MKRFRKEQEDGGAEGSQHQRPHERADVLVLRATEASGRSTLFVSVSYPRPPPLEDPLFHKPKSVLSNYSII